MKMNVNWAHIIATRTQSAKTKKDILNVNAKKDTQGMGNLAKVI